MIYTVAGRRIQIHDREEWQSSSQPVTGPTPYPDLVHHFVVHWPGASDSWKPPTDTAAYLRSGQADYLANRGYSYGYGFAIGVNPINWNVDPVVFDAWEVRGFDIRIASNNGDINGYENYADPNFNGRSNSVQVISSKAYPATNDQIMQARYLVSVADSFYKETLAVIPHCESDSTGCPGDYLCSQIDEIATRPTAGIPVPPDNGDDMTDADIERIVNAVWAEKFSVPDKAPQTAGWILAQSYQLLQRTVRASEEAAANTRDE